MSTPRLLTFPIEADHPLIPHWEALQKDISAALKEAGIEWSTMGVRRLRETLEPVEGVDDTTVVITARRKDEEQWRMLEEIVLGVCREHGQESLKVELINGGVSLF